jgi:hypothetical protein
VIANSPVYLLTVVHYQAMFNIWLKRYGFATRFGQYATNDLNGCYGYHWIGFGSL